jgi:hypothetical protein
MPITDDQVDAVGDSAVKNAVRGVKSLTIGDRRLDYISPADLIDAKRKLAEEENGGIYDTVPAPKGYF